MAWILTIVRNLCYTRLKAGRICEDISQYDHLSLEEETGAAIDRLVLQKALDILAIGEKSVRKVPKISMMTTKNYSVPSITPGLVMRA